MPCEVESVVERSFDGGTVAESAAVDPYQDRLSHVAVYGFGPEVEVLAVFSLKNFDGDTIILIRVYVSSSFI